MQKGINDDYKGLTSAEAIEQQQKYGKNELVVEKKENIFHKILHIISEPMFLLLIIAATIYFILGEPKDGAVMLIFVIGIISVEAIQEWKTDKTLKALKNLSAPQISVLRDGIKITINSADLVPGDIMYISEGVKVPADGIVIKASTLCIDESSLTGESEPVWKISQKDTEVKTTDYWKRDYCYAGTLVTQGTGVIRVDKIGLETEYGKIGKGIADAPETSTPLQVQTDKLVKLCAIIALVLFVLVGISTYFNIPDHDFKNRIIESVLSGITLAMAMIPEEFPVILTVFLSMGAWRLAKKQSLIRRLPSVEILGAVSVLCVDKTGTITMNKMSLRETYSFTGDEIYISKIMGMGCKIDAYDPMEKAMLTRCNELGLTKEELFKGKLIKEYPFLDETKMMGHVWQVDDKTIIAAKGSPEKIIAICNISSEDKSLIEEKIYEMANQGLRVIAIAEKIVKDETEVPSDLLDCNLQLLGLVGLADPPRETVKEDIKKCTAAGVRVIMITGDSGITASSIAKQIDMPNYNNIISGEELTKMSDEDLQDRVKTNSIFCRVLPEHKMRIVKALQSNGEIVAMTGDGVNDAPALKYSNIGIAMGKRGSEVSREAADLILLDDNFSTIVSTIEDGRRIYDNVKKAIGYVFTIHIPIAFASLFAPLLGINPASLLLLPLHVVLLELIIDPTCSIVLERQPAEHDIMRRPPRNPKEKLLTASSLFKSIMQGLVIFAASFSIYLMFLNQYPNNVDLARTMGLSVILFSNILLVQVNSSNTQFAYQTFIKQIKDKVMWMATIGTVLGLIIMIYTPLNEFLKLAPLTANQLLISIGLSCIAVLWYEIVKLVKYIFLK